jgi:type III pantothenate kinase
VKRSWRIITREKTGDEYAVVVMSMFQAAGHHKDEIEKVGICSVVPSETRSVTEAFAGNLGMRVWIMDGGTDCGIKVETDHPAEVGADRIANAVGAYYEYGGPAILVDLGTATTFDVVSAKGEYRGGVIAPGMLAGAKDLWTKARMLPAIEIKKPGKIIGTTTVQCMESGIFYGAVGQIEGIVKRMWGEMGSECRVLMTGGYSALVWDSLCFEATFDPDLTLKGIAYAMDPALRGRRAGF